MWNANCEDVFPEMLWLPIPTNLILDQPRETDYEYEAVFWAIEPIKKRMRVPKITIWNQWAEVKTRMACWNYAMTHIVNAQNTISDAVNKVNHIELNPWIIWKEKLLPINPDAEYEWTTIQSNLDLFKSLWLITGFAKVKTKEEIMDALDHQRYIFTGSQTWDWQNVRDNHIYKVRTDWKIVWHFTAYFTYDKDFVYWVNSYWPDNWKFKCSWDIFLNDFYTQYAISDSRDEKAFIKFRQIYS